MLAIFHITCYSCDKKRCLKRFSYLQTGNVVTTLEVGGVGRGAVGSSSHSIAVVLADKDGGELPELGHVVCFEDLTLVGGTITVKGESGGLVAEVLLGKRDTSSQGNLGTDNSVSSIEVGGEHVHGTTLTARDTGLASEKLGQDGGDRATAHVGESVAAVGSDDLVLGGQGSLHSDGNSLLLSREMKYV